ncbi:MAG: hypothetical protein MR274_05490 [Clostridium sp.]|nr:hypothetical protein [Clostridium sp.]
MNKKIISLFMSIVFIIGIFPNVISFAEEKDSTSTSKNAVIRDNPQQLIYIDSDESSLFVSDRAILEYDKNYDLTNKGDIKNLVIFIRFSDQDESSVYKSISGSGNGSISEIQEAFNGDTYSLYDYTKSISAGQFSVKSEFYPKNSSGDVITYQDSYPLSYYQSTIDSSKRKTELMKNALNAVAEQVDNKSQFDYNKDGILDYVTFVVPNMGNWGEALWPTCITYSSPITISNELGIKMRKAIFVTTPYFKNYGTTKDMYKVLAHESMHMIGMNDLYSNASYEPVGNWSVMCNNNGHPTVYEKSEYGKWITNIKDASKSGTYIVSNTTEDPAINTLGYKIAVDGLESYYMIECRNKLSSIYEKNIEGSGIVVYKVNPSVRGNLNGSPYEVEVIKPTNSSLSYLNSTAYQYDLTLGSEKFTIKLSSITSNNAIFTVESTVKDKELSINGFETSVASPQEVGKEIKLSASATGSGTVRYHFYVYEGTKLKEQSKLSTMNNYLWKPTTAGTYTLKVVATDSTKKIVSIRKTYKITNSALKIISLTSDLQSPQKVGTEIIFRTSVTGASGEVTYRYEFSLGSTVLSSKESTSNGVSFTPQTAGDWSVKVYVKDECGIVLTKTMQFTIEAEKLKIVGVTIPSNMTTGNKYLISTQTSGGTGNVLYRYTLTDGNTTLGNSYSTSNAVNVTLGTSGYWYLLVEAKDDNDTVEYFTSFYVY